MIIRAIRACFLAIVFDVREGFAEGGNRLAHMVLSDDQRWGHAQDIIDPPSTEQYSQDMSECAAQIKAKQPTTACSPAVAEQAQAIVDDSEAVAEATKSEANPDGLDVVYWIAPKNGAEKSSSKLVFHLCEDVSTLRNKVVNSGSVTEAYAQNAVRLTKQIASEQRQCGFAAAE